MKYKVGDELYFNNKDSESSENNGPCIVVRVSNRESTMYRYTVNVIGGQLGWLASEDELRPLTKLDKALK